MTPDGAPTGEAPVPHPDERAWELSARTADAATTKALAQALATVCRAGDVILLSGSLGAGKTTFAQGFARGLGVTGPVTSPTFTLVRQYPCAVSGVSQLVHADVYRLDSLDEVADLALPELADGAVTLVEWGERAEAALGSSTLFVALHRVPRPDQADDETRRVTVAGRGVSWAGRREEVASALAPFLDVANRCVRR